MLARSPRPLTPVEIHALRSHCGRRVAAPKPTPQPRISAARKRAIVDKVANILASGEPTRFAGEGACRHGIRSALCLRSWSWPLADVIARDIVSAALSQIGAERPTWKQGQPEYTQDGHNPIERTRCRHCGRDLPEHGPAHMIFCSPRCRSAWHSAVFKRFRQAELAAAREAGDAAR